MQIPVIKKLAENYSIDELSAAEEALINEQTPAIPIEGKDEGEQLTHVLAAIHVLHDVKNNGVALHIALRNYTQRVRNSITND